MAMSLNVLPLFHKSKIISIDGNDEVQRKLKSMGILVGLDVEVVKQHYRTPSIIKIGDTKIAVGKTIMKAILVQ